MRAIFFALACLSFPALGQTTDTWTLERCLEHAFEHNLQLKQSQLGLRQSEIATLTAKGAFLPNLNASSSFGVNIGQTIDPFTNQFATDAVQSKPFAVGSPCIQHCYGTGPRPSRYYMRCHSFGTA